MHQRITVEGAEVRLETGGRVERHAFASAAEADARARFVREALTWIGTPFKDCADVKGPNGAVDCAMLLVRCAVDTGLIPPIDPRPYSPRLMLHSTEEKSEKSFSKILTNWLGAKEVERPRFGDVHVYQFGRMFSHGGIRINDLEIVHAYGKAGCTLVSGVNEPLLKSIPMGAIDLPRPVKYFDVTSFVAR